MSDIEMNTKNKVTKKNYIWAILNNKCPHCRKGNIFQDKSSYHLKSFMKMNEACPLCGQKTEIEPGFYIGTGYVSYAISVAFSVSTFVAWWVLIGLSVDDNRIFGWLATNTVLIILAQPYLMRLSRTFWLSFFVSYEINWRSKKSTVMLS